MEYFKFGMETMRVTQNPDGRTSHYNHSHGNPADYPIDVAGVDGGQSAYFAMCDMKVVAIRGVGNKVTNTIWLETTEKVQTPTFRDIVWLALTHWNDGSKTSKYKVGDIIKKGTIFTYEGTDGATGNHLHLVCGRGHCKDWVKNNKGSWVMQGESMSPEKVMYVDKSFTKIANDGGLKFQEVPKEPPKTNTITNSFFGSKGYFGYGDTHTNIGKIAKFMYKTFPAYTKSSALGNYFGPNLQSSIRTFQSRTGLEADGNVGPKTLKKLKEYGFKE